MLSVEDQFESGYQLQLFSCSLAQLVECLPEAQKVTGSIPVGSTIFNLDVSEVLDKKTLAEMIKLAKAGAGLNSFLNKHPQVRKYGYLDTTLGKGSFKPY